MLELLNALDCVAVPISLVREAFEGTAPQSKLRRLMAEEVYCRIESKKWGTMTEDLDQCDGLPGFTSALGETIQRLDNKWGPVCPRLNRIGDPALVNWENYMVQGGPEQHWVHARRGLDVPLWTEKKAA